ncbi:WD repeat-containing protein 85 [Balamuthia mandrillaris]
MDDEETRGWEELGCMNTKYSADVVEFCPVPSWQSCFVVGTYQLQQETRERVGCLWSLEVDAADDGEEKGGEGETEPVEGFSKENPESGQIVPRQFVPTNGTLDAKWNHHCMDGKAVLAAANARSELALYALQEDKTLALLHSQTLPSLQPEEAVPSALCLSLDWNNRLSATTATSSIATSHSDHRISIWDCEVATGQLQLSETWEAHEHEAWIVAWNYWDTSVLYSGGDDCTFKGWDRRVSKEQPTFTKRYDVGVTTIQTHPLREHCIAVGSYDENISIWDARKIGRRPLHQHNVGGGVWRIKWHPSDASLMAVACMHADFQIVRFSPSSASPMETVLTYAGKHRQGALAYGIDWSHSPPSSSVLGSCSFYDRCFTLWKMEEPSETLC